MSHAFPRERGLEREAGAARERERERATAERPGGGSRRAPAKAEERLFGGDAARAPGSGGMDINEADAANLDFGALQALISQQMASIEAEWEPDLGGRPSSTDFLRAEAADFREE